VALAQGSVYKNGFTSAGNKYYDGVVGAFYNGVVGIHELMGDVVSAEAANTYMNNLSAPDMVSWIMVRKFQIQTTPHNKKYCYVR